MRTIRCGLIVLFGLVVAVGAARGDDGEPGSLANPYQVPLIKDEIIVDGSLEEAAWRQALELEIKFEVRPGENVEPPVRTAVLLAYDKTKLYIAFRAFDPNPSAIRAHLMDRDSAWYDDWVGVVLDTFNDERRSFNFVVNPLGVQMDLTETSESEDEGFDAIWDSKGRIYDWGFAVEIAIPFTSLRFQRTGEDQVWGFDAHRSYKRSVDHRMGLFPRDRSNNCYLCQTVKIKGFAGVAPGRNIEIAPTLTAVRTDARDEVPNGDFQEINSDVEAGVTARWGLTPNMTVSAAVNPDFSQVEADALQLDINEPFALYYSEKRPFFTEGVDYFRTPFDIVYTRTMRNPEWGLKLTGKEGANTIGAYVVRDEINNLIFPGSQGSSATSLDENVTASVFRYKRDVGSKYTLGLMATDREGGDYYNRVLGFDGSFRFTNTDLLRVSAFGSSTRYSQEVAGDFSQPHGNFKDYLWSVYYAHSTRDYRIYSQYKDVGADFRADLGYMPQVGYKYGEIGGEYKWWGDSSDFLNRITAGANWDKTVDQDGSPIEEEIEGSVFMGGPKQSELDIYFGARDRYYEGKQFDQAFLCFDFEINPIGILEVGTYFRYDDRIDYAHARAAKGTNWLAYMHSSVGRNLRFTGLYEVLQLSVQSDRLFITNTIDTTMVYQFNTRTFFRATLQFADIRRNQSIYAFAVEPVTRDLFTQLLFSYKINPQTVLFIGYSDNYYGTQEFSITQTDRTFFMKLGYAWVL